MGVRIAKREEIEELLERQGWCDAVKTQVKEILEHYKDVEYFYVSNVECCCDSCILADALVVFPALDIHLCREIDNVLTNTMIMTEAPEAMALVKIRSTLYKYCNLA